MKISSLWSTCFSNGELRPIEVQVQIRSGIPKFDIIGLPQNMIKEGKDRILSGLACLGVDLNSHKILVSLNPGDIPKEGSHFDLPILVGVLRGLGLIPQGSSMEFFWGEVSLTGRLQLFTDGLAHLLFASQLSATRLVSAPLTKERNILEQLMKNNHFVVDHIKKLTDTPENTAECDVSSCSDPRSEAYWVESTPAINSWDQLQGTEFQRLFWIVAMIGRHHVLLEGPPGSGKTSWSRAAQLLQPPLEQTNWATRFKYQPGLSETLASFDEFTGRPFIDPHHSSSRTALIGGGSGKIFAGAVTRAHLGILFLDEIAEFSRDCLEGLREPMETKTVSIARRGLMQSLHADFQVISTMNPCRCGNLGSKNLCNCTSSQFAAYHQRLSGPLRDRFHMKAWWEYKSSPPSFDFKLKNIRKRIVGLTEKSEIDLSGVPPIEGGSARERRNKMDVFVSWCRWLDLTKPSHDDFKNFRDFFDAMENQNEKK